MALAFGLVACASQSAQNPQELAALRDLLNSERIERLYGNYGLKVLESDTTSRVSLLYSQAADGRRTGRTLAVVFFPGVMDPRLDAEHREILGGGSIGATFKARGWQIEKRNRYFGELELASGTQLAQNMGLTRRARLAVYVYTFGVRRGDEPSIEYATLAELYHPSYLRLADLRQLQPPGAPFPTQADPTTGLILERLRRVMR